MKDITLTLEESRLLVVRQSTLRAFMGSDYDPLAAWTEPPMLRLKLEDDGSVSMCTLDIQAEGVSMGSFTSFPNRQALPKFAADQLSRLVMLKEPYPSDHVKGVGRRVTETVFWIEHTSD